MLRTAPHPFRPPTRRAPAHRLALAGVALGLVLAGGALFAPAAGTLVTDEALATALPYALLALPSLLAAMLVRLGRDSDDA